MSGIEAPHIMNGVAITLVGGPDDTPEILAHELGHYLGLGHVSNDGSNVMFPARVAPANMLHLDSGQATVMRPHSMMQQGLAL